MAKYFKLLLLMIALLMTSCQEGHEAGDLLGQWRLSGSDTKYISFAGSVVLFRGIQEGQVFGNFQHVGDSLFIQCVSINGLPSDTVMVEKSFGFKPFTDIRLHIDAVDSDQLMLSKGGQHWHFYQY